MGDENESMVQQRWTREQIELAAQVHIPREDWTDVVCENEDFRLVSLEAHENDDGNNTLFGGVDVSFPKNEADHKSVAVYVIVDWNTMHVVYEDVEYFALDRRHMPYIPTFLAVREIDPLVRLIQRQTTARPELRPRAILVDGNGIWHPRGAGLACAVGVRTGIPTIGMAKTLYCMGGVTRTLVARGVAAALVRARGALPKLMGAAAALSNERVLFAKQVIQAGIDDDDDDVTAATTMDIGPYVGALEPYCRGLAIPLAVPNEDRDNMFVAGEKILACAVVGHGGQCAGARRGGTKKPVFVSVGHGLSLRSAVEITVSLSRARIPEPIRQADLRGRDRLHKLSPETDS